MVLATADADGAPERAHGAAARRSTNAASASTPTATRRRAGSWRVNPRAALVFPWIAIHRQVDRSAGTVPLVSDADSDAYWDSRPRESRISALASPQSEVVPSRPALEQTRDALAADADADLVPARDWGGYRVSPAVEFWQGRDHRFHDRLRYRLRRRELGARAARSLADARARRRRRLGRDRRSTSRRFRISHVGLSIGIVTAPPVVAYA